MQSCFKGIWSERQKLFEMQSIAKRFLRNLSRASTALLLSLHGVTQKLKDLSWTEQLWTEIGICIWRASKRGKHFFPNERSRSPTKLLFPQFPIKHSFEKFFAFKRPPSRRSIKGQSFHALTRRRGGGIGWRRRKNFFLPISLTAKIFPPVARFHRVVWLYWLSLVRRRGGGEEIFPLAA